MWRSGPFCKTDRSPKWLSRRDTYLCPNLDNTLNSTDSTNFFQRKVVRPEQQRMTNRNRATLRFGTNLHRPKTPTKNRIKKRATTTWRTEQRIFAKGRSSRTRGGEGEASSSIIAGTSQAAHHKFNYRGDRRRVRLEKVVTRIFDATFGTHRKGPSHRANSMVRASRVPWTFSSLAKTE